MYVGIGICTFFVGVLYSRSNKEVCSKYNFVLEKHTAKSLLWKSRNKLKLKIKKNLESKNDFEDDGDDIIPSFAYNSYLSKIKLDEDEFFDFIYEYKNGKYAFYPDDKISEKVVTENLS